MATLVGTEWNPKPRIPDSTSKISQILDSTSKDFSHSGIWITLHGMIQLSASLAPHI